MSRPIFSLDDARALLPRVRQLTAEAVLRAEALAEELQRVPEQDPAHAQLSAALQDIVNGWADEVRALGVEVKGLWLVDFDNGEGYYCWNTRRHRRRTTTATRRGSPGGCPFSDPRRRPADLLGAIGDGIGI